MGQKEAPAAFLCHHPAMKEIHAVVEQLDDIIDWARAADSPLGYFAALYRRVTVAVGEGIEAGMFEDARRMARFDAVFAQRYLEAVAALRRGDPTMSAWTITFECGRRWSPIVIQHLLGGMNAHINLDLGIAAATVAPGPSLPGLRKDFITINTVLASLLEDTKQQLAEIWTPMALLDRLFGETDDQFVRFSMNAARDGAWRFAERLAELPEEQWGDAIAARDAVIGGQIADMIYRPAWPVRVLLLAVRLSERGSVDDKLEILAGALAQAQAPISKPSNAPPVDRAAL